MPRISFKGFQITHADNVVTLEKQLQEHEDFDTQLNIGKSAIYAFSGKLVWGCDGVGYYTAKRNRQIVLNRGGVTKQAFDRGLERLGFKLNKFVKRC